jgi:hypothetical protein
LGVSEPKLLPDNPLYFLKNWSHKIRSLFTLNPVKKLELQEKIASEKLLELRKLTENGVKPEIIQRATDKYNQEMEKMKNQARKIKDTAESSPTLNKFLDKFTEQQVLHQQILEKLQDQVPTQVYQKIEEARTKHLEKFEEVMQKLELRKENADEKVQKVCIELWDPVCGKDGKTYNNKCFAKLAGIEVAYKGDCSVSSGSPCRKDTDCVGTPKRGVMACVNEKCKVVECKVDGDCPQSKCGTETTTNTKCVGATVKCVNRKCVQVLGRQCTTDADCGTPNPATPAPGSSIIQYRCVQSKCMLEL